uniref:Brinker DNA-binding domain-containing protein n=1 Tax=Meloidogyne enterolobii TaxID=390850 RepID=A0A6V7UZJ3_MELEN|nr:unnamed protein product [Meloidogyne enterolobii]
MAENENNLSSDDEGPSTKKRRASYTIDFKIQALEFALKNNISMASRHFNVDRKQIRMWIAQRDKLGKRRSSTPQHFKKHRLEGGGRPLHDIEFEKTLLDWIKDQRAKRSYCRSYCLEILLHNRSKHVVLQMIQKARRIISFHVLKKVMEWSIWV